MKEHNETTIFKKEWELFLKRNNYKSTPEALRKNDDLQGYTSQRETINRFCNGKRRLSASNLEFFSKLFGVREDYLAGKDAFRTDDVVMKLEKASEMTLESFANVVESMNWFLEMFTNTLNHSNAKEDI